MPPRSIHFNGSVNLADTDTVMREISSRIPLGVRRMTDGETGERGYWIHFQIEKFLAMPEFETVSNDQLYETAEDAPPLPKLRLAPGASVEAIAWPDLGYANAYAASYAVFTALQRDRVIAPDVRFQMQYPTPLASMAGTFVPEVLPELAPAYERALFADLDRALAAVPADRCAVQWDVAIEVGLLSGAFGPKAPLAEVVPGLVRCVERVPEAAPVGMHLCYGDYGHQHFIQPESLALQVELINAVVAAASRQIDWFSITVPQAQRDPAYFAPLRDLAAGLETELSFGLVPYHPADQAPDTTADQVALIDANLGASTAGLRGWAISTECGMGRATREEIPTLLDLHREILERHG